VACLVKKVLEELEYSGEKIEELLDIGLVAMGRSGGQELGFGSDLDAMVIYDARPGMPVALAQKAAEMVVSEVRKLSRDPLLEFEIDLDLRPEGKNGPVARSIDSYRAYYARWGDVWENQALLRARMFFGSTELQQNFEELVNLYRYPFEIEQKSIVEIRRIKARMEAERLPQGVEPKRHLKLGPGSLSDVEWVVQLVQLRYGNLHPEIRTPRTLEALAAMVEVGLIEKHDATVLREAWEISSRIRSAIVLATNKRSDLLPIDRKALEAVSRVLGYPRGSASVLEEEYLAKTRRSRMVFERLFFA
jgi:glutamate-ammonia-ligase adenylyltransferase